MSGATSRSTRHRGSSASKARKPDPRAEKDGLPAWDEVDISPSQRKALSAKYADVPEAAARKFITAELTGRAQSLRLQDIVPADALKHSFTGETYALIQAELDAKGEGYTSLDLLQAVMRCKKVALSTRMSAAEKCLPYEHAKLSTPGQQLPQGAAIIVVPGQTALDDWEKVAAEHSKRISKLEADA